jgi:hypothetical protein
MLPPDLQPEAVQTWVSSRRKFIALPGQLSAVINNKGFVAMLTHDHYIITDENGFIRGKNTRVQKYQLVKFFFYKTTL